MIHAAETAEGSFEFEDTTLSDAPDLIVFAKSTLACNWNEAFVKWKYFCNPTGPFYGRCARLDGRAVGFYGNTPVRLKIGNRTVIAAQAVDGMIAPEQRRQGLFVALAQQTYRQMDEAGIALAYAFPNPVSKSAFLKRLAWTEVGDIPRFVKLLDVDAIVRESARKGLTRDLLKLLLRTAQSWALRGGPAKPNSQIRIHEFVEFDERFDDLWHLAATKSRLAIVRDRVYLNWRYVQNPSGQYSLLAAFRGDDLVGYTVLSKRDLGRGILAIAEWLVAPNDEMAAVELLRASEVRARALNADQLQCWMLPHQEFYSRLLKRNGFIHTQAKYAPGIFSYSTPFNIRVAPDSELSPDPRQLGNWYLTMGDHDYY